MLNRFNQHCFRLKLSFSELENKAYLTRVSIQTSVPRRIGVRQQSASFWHRLMGAEDSLDLSIKSPYTSRILKPFIR